MMVNVHCPNAIKESEGVTTAPSCGSLGNSTDIEPKATDGSGLRMNGADDQEVAG